jgi:hypothetical protein
MFEMRDLPRGDDVAAGKLLGERFVEDPAWRWMGPRWERHRRFVSTVFHLGEVKMCRRRGGWMVGGYEDGRLVGVTIAFPKGEEPRPWQYWVTRTIAFILAGPLPGIRAAILGDRLDKSHPKEPHVHAWLVAAEPGAMGAGALLVREITERADAIDRRVYLEATAPHLVSLYSLLGFKTTDTLMLRNGDPIGLMWRDVGASRAPATASGRPTNEEVAWQSRSGG